MVTETQFNEELMRYVVWIRILSARAVKRSVFKSLRFYVVQVYVESGLGPCMWTARSIWYKSPNFWENIWHLREM
jgi:hypothetical protein